MSLNFSFLSGHNPVFEQLAQAAERNLGNDANTTLMKLRQLAEAFARHAADATGVWPGPQASQLEVLRALESRGIIERDVAAMFHALRIAGNEATHDFVGSRHKASESLKLARKLAIWFHRTFGGVNARTNFKPGPFVPPPDPFAEFAAMQKRLDEAHELVEQAQARAELEKALKQKAEEESRLYGELANEAEARLVEVQKTFVASLTARKEVDEQQVKVVRGLSVNAGALVDLDEADTRLIIDAQLRETGWEADSAELRASKGVRPETGRNIAISEWPTPSGPADYALFRGLELVAIVEAKRRGKNVADSIEQARRYADSLSEPVPFLFATNGRAFMRQWEQESGVWFLDARRSTNHPRPLVGWHSPDRLGELLAQDVEEAERALVNEPTGYLGLRDYQLRAITSVEEALAQGKRTCLLAMATGTGKTKTVIGLIYRLLKTQRFKRVLFLVDRSTLGEQAQNAFKDMRLESERLFTEIFELKELGDIKPDASTRVQVATVQGMVQRVLHAADPLPIDAYDCIIVDESHRGYTLDREMGEGEESTRDAFDYVSTYRRVLDHFDAVKIGLTATPALHTREIFGDPVFTYAYPEAVADGFLVDHEPPVRLITRLAEEGIVFEKGKEVPVIVGPGQMTLWEMEDDLTFEIESFNRQVVTEGFNRVIATYLAEVLDPNGDEKTLIFCANDVHADLVVRLLKDAFDDRWGPIDDRTVMKITGAADKVEERIRRYRNEKHPVVAVTVDLLTTGVDIPRICNLVFLRRVRSRILYEQMLGRATRLCDEIGKEVFRIYDAVDLYSALAEFTEMKPLVKDVNIPAGQLLDELVSPKSHEASSSGDRESHADDVLVGLIERLRRKTRQAAADNAQITSEFQEARAAVEDALDVPLEDLPAKLRELGAQAVVDLLIEKPALRAVLETLLTVRVTPPKGVYVSEAGDELRRTETVLAGKLPADYLEAFGKFIHENLNTIPALSVIARRPKALTRAQLKEIKLALSAAEFRERDLKVAWREVKNEDIAAGIVGFIRQQAVGSPLVSYSVRVDRGLEKMLSSRAWTPPQRRWLELLAKQVKAETVVDRAALDAAPFKDSGGFRTLERVFEGKTDEVLADLHEAIWADAA